MKFRTVLILIAIFALGLLLGICWSRRGSDRAREATPGEVAAGRSEGRGRPQAGDRSALDAEQRRALEKLRTLGYLSGSRKAPSRKGVVTHDPEKTAKGVNLVVSGHGPQAQLMDNSGRVLHEWRCSAARAWPGMDIRQTREEKTRYWRRAWLMPNGDLYAIFEGTGIIKVDKDSRLIWALRNGAHHDLYVSRDGTITLLTRKAHINPDYNAAQPILEDFITVLSPEGKGIRERSILDILRDNPGFPYLKRTSPDGDIFHTNTIEIVEKGAGSGRCPWPAGSLILSLLKLDLVMVVAPDWKSIIWAESDYWNRQHQPTLLDNGNLLVFNNNRTPRSFHRSGTRDASTVVEMDPVSRRIVWSYRGDEQHPFYSPACGSGQRLPNGNTLITESDSGRAFEVTPGGEIVWEYLNPHRVGLHRELIATLLEVIRFDWDSIRAWYKSSERPSP